MSSTTAPAPRVLAAPAVERDGVEPEADVLGLGAVGTLGFVVERRRPQAAAAAEELRAVTHWADLHRVGPDGLGSVDPEVGHAVCWRSQALGLPGVLGVGG